MGRSARMFFGKCAIVLLLLAALLLAESWLAGQLSFLGLLCLGSPCLLSVGLLLPRVSRRAAPKQTRRASRTPVLVPAPAPRPGNRSGPFRKAA